jgi:DNA uptake protein ComE-like DNA-binding protein
VEQAGAKAKKPAKTKSAAKKTTKKATTKKGAKPKRSSTKGRTKKRTTAKRATMRRPSGASARRPSTSEWEPDDTKVSRPKKPAPSAKAEGTTEAPIEDTQTRRRRGLLDLNDATFEQLRSLGMSVTQATRVIAYRERQDGFADIDDLDAVPGFPKAFLAELKQELTA